MKHTFYEEKSREFDVNKHMDLLLNVLQNKPLAKNLIIRWSKIILSIYKEEGYPAPIDYHHETYSFIVKYTTGFFEYVFNIDIANEIIFSSKKQPVEMSIREAKQYVDLDNLHENSFTKVDNHRNPIILIKSKIFDRPQCINGNHRILDAYKKGQRTISLYCLEEAECLPMINTKLSKAMFMMNTDLNMVLFEKNKQHTSFLIEESARWLSETK
ncbi:hypothetical protein ACFVS2_20660 [Brevibacillus sp. NPDC058079]|uniref:hypothetical protein n=1 Tax=Brevibacillus sp. NPDC058079 TaxID=3346330 RepID=UPI0036E08E31